jgi:hypothetical protein
MFEEKKVCVLLEKDLLQLTFMFSIYEKVEGSLIWAAIQVINANLYINDIGMVNTEKNDKYTLVRRQKKNH